MWELDHKESWAPKNWCFWAVVLEKTLESPLDCKEIKPVNPKGNQSWIFLEGTDAEAEIPIVRPTDAKNWLIWKDPDAGKDWRREKGMIENEMASPTQWTWVWASSGSWRWTGKPGVLQSMGVAKSQRQLSDWNELNPIVLAPFVGKDDQFTSEMPFHLSEKTINHICVPLFLDSTPFYFPGGSVVNNLSTKPET